MERTAEETLPALPEIPEPSPEAQSLAHLMGEVRNLFMEESESAARVLRMWLAEARHDAAPDGEHRIGGKAARPFQTGNQPGFILSLSDVDEHA